MITRQEMMQDSKNLYEPYMAQFVTPAVLHWVEQSIGIDVIKNSQNPHFNDIPLQRWDAFYNTSTFAGEVSRALRDSGDVNARSIANACSVAKAAARIIKTA